MSFSLPGVGSTFASTVNNCEFVQCGDLRAVLRRSATLSGTARSVGLDRQRMMTTAGVSSAATSSMVMASTVVIWPAASSATWTWEIWIPFDGWWISRPRSVLQHGSGRLTGPCYLILVITPSVCAVACANCRIRSNTRGHERLSQAWNSRSAGHASMCEHRR